MNRRNSFLAMSMALAILVTFSLNASAASTPRRTAILQLNPVAYWQFSATTIEQPVLDQTQNHNDGYFEGLASGLPGSGPDDQAAVFGPYPGVNLTQTSVAAQGNAARSIIAWVKTTNTEPQAILATGTPAQSEAFNVVVDYAYSGNGVVGVMGFFDDFYPTTGKSVADGNWHMVAVTYDGGGNLKIYIDGNLDNGTVISYSTEGQSNYIGRSNHVGYERGFQGSIADPAVFHYALSAAQVASLAATAP
jgi:Concanavalin A-like lectin/glucanases superfamily